MTMSTLSRKVCAGFEHFINPGEIYCEGTASKTPHNQVRHRSTSHTRREDHAIRLPAFPPSVSRVSGCLGDCLHAACYHTFRIELVARHEISWVNADFPSVSSHLTP
jgi:hypothetical protein